MGIMAIWKCCITDLWAEMSILLLKLCLILYSIKCVAGCFPAWQHAEYESRQYLLQNGIKMMMLDMEYNQVTTRVLQTNLCDRKFNHFCRFLTWDGNVYHAIYDDSQDKYTKYGINGKPGTYSIHLCYHMEDKPLVLSHKKRLTFDLNYFMTEILTNKGIFMLTVIKYNTNTLETSG